MKVNYVSNLRLQQKEARIVSKDETITQNGKLVWQE